MSAIGPKAAVWLVAMHEAATDPKRPFAVSLDPSLDYGAVELLVYTATKPKSVDQHDV